MGIARLPKRMLRTFLISLVGTFGTSMVFFLLNFLSLQMTDSENIRYHLKLSFENKNYPMARGGNNDFNDCLISAMTLLRNAPVGELTVSPLRIYGLQRPQDICRGLKQVVYDGFLSKDQYITVFYHQYLNGQRTIFSFLLDNMRVKDIRATLFAMCYLFLLLNLLLLVYQIGKELFHPPNGNYVHGGNELKQEFLREKLSLVIFSLCFLSLYDLSEKADSFTSSITDIFIFTFLSMATLFNFLLLKFNVRVIFFTVFGALVAYFELLHGAVPLTIAVIIGVFCVQRIGGQSEMARFPLCLEALVAFLTAFVGCFVLKIITVNLVFPVNMVANFFDLLMYRMTGAERTISVPEEIRSYFTGHDASFLGMITGLSTGFGISGFGSKMLGYIVVISSVIILAFFTMLVLFKPRIFRTPPRIMGLIFSASIIGFWYLAFLEHTFEHPFFMSRLLVWPIAISCVLLMEGMGYFLYSYKGWRSSITKIIKDSDSSSS